MIHQLVLDIINHAYDDDDDVDETLDDSTAKHERIYENTGFGVQNGISNPALVAPSDEGIVRVLDVNRYF